MLFRSYRAVALFAADNNIDTADRPAVAEMLKDLKIRMAFEEGRRQKIFINGAEAGDRIRLNAISKIASDISAYQEVRAFLLDLQREIARENDVVMDGRDIGTVVLPDAQIKIFLTATPKERARRRFEELCLRGQKADYDEILKEVRQRDDNDTNRPIAPLKKADDAILIDTTGNALEQSVDLLIALVRGKLEKQVF